MKGEAGRKLRAVGFYACAFELPGFGAEHKFPDLRSRERDSRRNFRTLEFAYVHFRNVTVKPSLVAASASSLSAQMNCRPLGNPLHHAAPLRVAARLPHVKHGAKAIARLVVECLPQAKFRPTDWPASPTKKTPAVLLCWSEILLESSGGVRCDIQFGFPTKRGAKNECDVPTEPSRTMVAGRPVTQARSNPSKQNQVFSSSSVALLVHNPSNQLTRLGSFDLQFRRF